MNVAKVAPLPSRARSRPAPPVRLLVCPAALEATQGALRSASAGEREALVLWSGRAVSDDTAVVSHLIAPECVASKDILVVPYSERIEVSRFLREHELLVFADLHTHPGVAFLSLADRARPFSVRPGFYAVVVPDFGIGKPLEGWRMYEAANADWEEVQLGERLGTESL